MCAPLGDPLTWNVRVARALHGSSAARGQHPMALPIPEARETCRAVWVNRWKII